MFTFLVLTVTLAIVFQFYWLLVRPVILQRTSYRLAEMRDKLIEAHLTNREGVKSQAFHELFVSLNSTAVLHDIGFLYPLMLTMKDHSYLTEVQRREAMMESAPSWLVKLEEERGFCFFLASVCNSPFLILLLIPLILALVSKRCMMQIKATVLAASEGSRRNNGNGSMLAPA